MEAVFGAAWPLIDEWRTLRASHPIGGKSLSWLVTHECILEMELAMLEKHGLTLPPEPMPLTGHWRRRQLSWRWTALYDTQRAAVNGVAEGPWSSTEAGTPVAVAEPAVNPRPPETDKGGAQLSALAVALMVIGGLAIGAIAGGIVVAGVYRRWGWTSFLWGADSPPAVIARGVATAVRWLNSSLTSIAHDVATVVRGVVRMVRRNH